MVFCGKPSKGCHACRKRKTRCDQKPDGCTQCERARRHCPGYRDLGLTIRNQSEDVIRKAKAKEAMSLGTRKRRNEIAASSESPLGAQSPANVYDNGTKGSIETSKRADSHISSFVSVSHGDDADSQIAAGFSPTYLRIPIEDLATLFFASNYIIHDGGLARGHLDYLAGLYNTNAMDEGLQACMKAVGFAGFSHVANAPNLMTNARYQYVKALTLTNAALASPARATEDTTLLSVMILGIYETVTGRTRRSLEAWANHVEGACALLKLRGPRQFRTLGGRRMFLQVVTSLMNNCIQCSKALPEFIVEWTREAKKDLLPSCDPTWLLQAAMMEFTDFRASIANKSCSNPKDILTRALELDSQYDSIYQTVSLRWKYQTIYTDVESEVIYNGCYHIYDDYRIANMWNAIRTVRILLHETIRDALLAGFAASPPVFDRPEHTLQFHETTKNIYKLQSEILASVPQHFGFVSVPGSPSLKSSSNSSTASPMPWSHFKERGCEQFPVLRTVGPAFLTSSLWLAGTMNIASQESQEFAIKILKRIAQSMGIQQALFLARVIEIKLKLRPRPD